MALDTMTRKRSKKHGDDLLPVPDEKLIPRPPYFCPDCGVDFERGAPDPTGESTLPAVVLVEEDEGCVVYRRSVCDHEFYFDKGNRIQRGHTL